MIDRIDIIVYIDVEIIHMGENVEMVMDSFSIHHIFHDFVYLFDIDFHDMAIFHLGILIIKIFYIHLDINIYTDSIYNNLIL